MTWHHVFIITVALLAPLLCGFSATCAASLPSVVQLATMTIAGALGHAGARALKRHDEKEERRG
jgi:hypothetical protein